MYGVRVKAGGIKGWPDPEGRAVVCKNKESCNVLFQTGLVALFKACLEKGRGDSPDGPSHGEPTDPHPPWQGTGTSS